MRSTQGWLHRPRGDDLHDSPSRRRPSDLWLVSWLVAFKSLILPDVTVTVTNKLLNELTLSTGEKIYLNSGRFMYMTAKLPFLKWRGTQIVRKSRNQIKILGAKRVTWSQFHSEDPQTWSTMLQKYSVCLCICVLWPIYVYMSVCIYVVQGCAIVTRILARVLNTNTNTNTVNVLFSQYNIYSLRIRLRVSIIKL